jgi:5-formyltetrahydrofolate cyclo-ligase
VTEAIEDTKQAIRICMWDLLEREGVVEPGVRGYIPNFTGAAEAADRLAQLPAWRSARVIVAAPDRAQEPVRERALRDGKLLYMAVPKLAEDFPFYILDPSTLIVPPAEAATREAAARVAPKAAINGMQPVDLVICGSVAVNRQGARLGKGAGYTDTELALLQGAELLTSYSMITTTVHSLQVLNNPIPENDRDFGLDLIVTPTEVIETQR